MYTDFSEFALFCSRQTTMIPCVKQEHFDECFDDDVIMRWGNVVISISGF